VRYLSYIGQSRNVTGLSGYGLGDAQIDAQNRTTDQIGQVGAAYSAVKNGGGLTVAYIQNAVNQIQGLINAYKSQYGTTQRGGAGAATLQNFVDTQIFPTMQSDLQTVAAVASGALPTGTLPGGFDLGPGGGGSSTNYNISLSPGMTATPGASDATAGNTQASGSPGPPSGITIPGTSIDVTATSPSWYENPMYLMLAGIGVLMYFGSKHSRS